MGKTARLEFGGKSYDLPVIEGSEGELALDISKLRAETGMITLDAGFVNTGACTSNITFLDGEKGILRYRGYPIEQMAEKSDFLEVTYLLIYGELPNTKQLAEFKNNVTYHTMIHEDLKHIFQAFPKTAHPMAILSSVVSALSTFYTDVNYEDPQAVDLLIWRLMGKLPTIAAWTYKKSVGQPFMYPRNNMDYCSNFLHMMFALPAAEYQPPKEFVEALNVLLILHADHEQNCSTSTVRMVGSSEANLYSSVSSGIAALSGPLHGGANQAVLEMLQGIYAKGGNIKEFVEQVKSKKSGVRLMGFGHRVYKNFDPRAEIIKQQCDKVIKIVGHDPLLDLAYQLEEIALKDEYFIQRQLYPNVDFYSGVIYKAIGFPLPMFTALFALGRLPGWIAHWREMKHQPSKIGRPRQIYTGPVQREYVPVDKR
ncbi:MAG: citrate synthase [SAR324 cluster bacterium]|nr:citrate synthase [SAR324 cluster bacterium]